jgi:propanol-preferring alcohol dehydrogenase
MRAALLTAFGQPLTITEIARPRPGRGEVLVKTAGCGICRTDLHMIDGLAYRATLPHVLGHEPAGVIAEVGAGVTGFAPGDRVVPYLFKTCHHCRACEAGDDAQCSDLQGILGVTMPGAFAEYFVAPADNLLPVPVDLLIESTGLAACAVVTSVRAVRRAGLESGQTAAVIGAGGIGTLVLQGLAARKVKATAIDPSEASRDEALKSGAVRAIAPDAATMGADFDRVFDLVGTAQSMGLAGKIIRRGGRIVVVGEEPEFPAIDSIAIAQRELEIVGSRNGSRADAEEALRLMAAGVLRPHVARRVPLAEINEALVALRRGDVHGRIVVTFGDTA